MKPSLFLLLSLIPFGLAALILGLGAPMVVQCDRNVAPPVPNMAILESDETVAPPETAPLSRVDVTVRQRVLGALTVRSTTLIDVVGAETYARSTRGNPTRSDSGVTLHLILRDGQVWNAPAAYSSVGTPPAEMAARIKEFIHNPSAPSLRMWCLSWVLHLVGLPPLLMGLLFAFAGLNVMRKNLTEGRRANARFRG